jgi:hypothetical protein
LSLTALVDQDLSCRAMGLRLPSSPEPPKKLPSQRFPSIELAGG